MVIDLVIVGTFVATIYGLALAFGSDSRDGNDWINHRAL